TGSKRSSCARRPRRSHPRKASARPSFLISRPMNTATERPALPPELLDHFATFDSPWGRRRLQARVAWKRAMWRGVVSGAHVAKRALDVAGSAAALVAFSPVFLAIALLIKLE